ncbi:hypothetical protein [Pacificibacter marinus]|uniref:hypothetical protein n=1 Tax=Pacificibacter marinus TaxID=658057 RepID=UPI001C07AB7C|nr:hypothetical protein [Pacificibacter marinus]MBU2865706.1 hypothetical protein [Pacificibacter marinus]
MSPDQYLRNILARERVETGLLSPVRNVATTLAPMLRNWGGRYLLAIEPSGSFAKGTGNRVGTDIDLLLSLSSSTPDSLAQIRKTLGNCLRQHGYNFREQNVSLGITVGGYQVDLVPGKRQSQYGGDHSLYRRKANTWTKTNIQTHVSRVRDSGRTEEIRVLKLWRDQKGLDFPSIYLELATLQALHGRPLGQLAGNVVHALKFFGNNLTTIRVIGPANTNNVISDDLSAPGKQAVASAAKRALSGKWSGIVT